MTNLNPAPPPGVVIPDLTLLRTIGRGSYGEVWLAHSVLGEFRAVKIVHQDGRHEGRPFEREFTGLQKFEPISRSHEGFVHILHAGRFDGGFFYVMELADDAAESKEVNRGAVSEDSIPLAPAGASVRHPSSAILAPFDYTPRTLRSDLLNRGRLPINACLELALKLTDALAHLHGHGLVHRDLKPSNIIFVRAQPKLADIGLVASTDASMSCVGTEGYLPPEGPGKPPGDLYALGKVLYEVATGRDRTDFPELPTLLRDDPGREALEELNEVILRACEPDVRRRYQTAAELRADLLLLKGGRSVRWTRSMSRRLAIARLAGGIATGAAVLSSGGFWLQRSYTREARRLRQLAEDLAARAQIQVAEDLFARGESSLAMAHLAQILRRDPVNRIAAERILAALSQRSFPRLSAPILQQSDSVLSAKFSPDAQWIATISRDRTVRLWNSKTGREVHAPVQHQAWINSVAFSPDGRRLVTASEDKTSLLLDVQTGAPVGPTLLHEGAVKAAAFDPSGEVIATASSDKFARLHDATTGRLRHAPLPHEDEVNALDFSPDGRWLATASEDASVRLWDLASGSLKHHLTVPGGCRRVRFSGNGKRLGAAFQRADTGKWQVRIWNLEAESLPAMTLPHENQIYHLAFSPDHQRLVVATANNRAEVWDVATGKSLFQLPHAALVHRAEFSPDGRQILTASADKTARLWDATTGAPAAEAMRHRGRVTHAEFSRDGRRLLTASWDHAVKLWEVHPVQSTLQTLSQPPWVLSAELDATNRKAITATGQFIFTASRINKWILGNPQSLALWDVETGERKSIATLPRKTGIVTTRFTHSGPLALIALQNLTAEKARSADPEFANQAQVWDVSDGQPVGESISHPNDIAAAHFSTDGSKLATGTTRGEIRIWDARRGIALSPPLAHSGWINSVRFSHDGTLLVSASREGSVMIWDVAAGARKAGPLRHGSEVWFAQFSPRGDRIVAVSTAHNAKIWSVTGTFLMNLPNPEPAPVTGSPPAPDLEGQISDPMEYAEFTQDGERVITTSGERARLWHADTGRQVTELTHGQLVLTARSSPDGLRVLTASFDGTAQLWDAATGLKLADPFRHGHWVSGAAFSPDGRRAITSSLDGTVKVWEILQAQFPLPEWFPLLAEAVAGQRLNAAGISEPVSWTALASLKSNLNSRPTSEPFIPWALQLLLGRARATEPATTVPPTA